MLTVLLGWLSVEMFPGQLSLVLFSLVLACMSVECLVIHVGGPEVILSLVSAQQG